MFNFLKTIKSILPSNEVNDEKENHGDCQAEYVTIASNLSSVESARISTDRASATFFKPSYTGNRSVYDSGSAKLNAKLDAFGAGMKVIDPYTGESLVLTKTEAKAMYGEDWTKHLAESDHIKPLEKIVNEASSNPWLKSDDVKAAANSKENMQIVSRQFNNAKRSRTNKEYVEDNEYLNSKGIRITEEGKHLAVQRGTKADASIRRQLNTAAAKNILKTGHEAGMLGAQYAVGAGLTTSSIMNLVAVMKGEKEPAEAIADTLKDGGKAAITGYVMSGGLTTVSHTLSSSSSKFIQALVKSNVPGRVISCVMLVGGTLKQWGNGEITTGECLTALGGKVVTFTGGGYGMAIGQTVIPIPVIGAAIGALVGSILTDKLYNNMMNALKYEELEHQERLRIINECRKTAEMQQMFRVQLESCLDNYFKDYKGCFDEALSEIRFAISSEDADRAIKGANKITQKLGGKVHYNNVTEFRTFLNDESVDIL